MTLTAPNLADFEDMAEDALALIPDHLRRLAADVIIRIEDFPDEETERVDEFLEFRQRRGDGQPALSCRAG